MYSEQNRILKEIFILRYLANTDKIFSSYEDLKQVVIEASHPAGAPFDIEAGDYVGDLGEELSFLGDAGLVDCFDSKHHKCYRIGVKGILFDNPKPNMIKQEQISKMENVIIEYCKKHRNKNDIS